MTDGVVEADLTPPDPAAEIPRRLASLAEAALERRDGQMARDLLRLLHLGAPPATLLRAAAVFDAERGQYGSTHVLPVAADLLARWDAVDTDALRLLALTAPWELAAEGHVRRPVRPAPAPVDPGPDLDAACARLRALVEAEESDAAEALLRGLLAQGHGRPALERPLLVIAADHFLDLGHAVIYASKLFDLADTLGDGALAELLPAWLVSVVTGTRHDVLPRWRWLRERLAALGDARPAEVDAPRDEARRDALLTALLGKDRDAAFDAVARALDDGALDDVLDALSLGAAERLLRFDDRVEADPTIQDDWLDVSHAFTYVHALRAIAPRFREPALARLLFYAVRYVNALGALDAAAPPAPPPEPPATLRDALTVALTRADLRPIHLAHLVKLSVAAFDEGAATGDPRPLRALARFLAAPFGVRRIPRLAHEAHRLLDEGRVPKTLW
ncbi:MAG: hypothetical protein H6745_06080 [Deltaproteobacteria bacterium]|nr:hypothetical protein [Deltaproteobacteria bacterium]